jgi:hypothetical protein
LSESQGQGCTRKDVTDHSSAVILKSGNFKHYVDYFNRMEDENIIQSIPNTDAWKWMESNIPLFECPQDNFEEIYYYRWWTFRKHIRETPQGYVITEFLVERSYADKYNMISCALGHHIYEARWLHNPVYLDDYINIWFRGNNGNPMDKLHNFSSWAADAVYNRYLVNVDRDWVIDILPDLVTDYKTWEKEKRLPEGLFWQYDLRDGMEESISGGRSIQNMRPTINSYMYGNAAALSKMAKLGDDANSTEEAKSADDKELQNDLKPFDYSHLSDYFSAKADTLKILVQEKLWNPENHFFETLSPEGKFYNVREAIGFIPWYFNLPDQCYEEAWQQITDPDGFLAPFGITTAERRHPEFRSHGCCNCEWDGAIWPFATSQILTAMANLLNNYSQEAVNNSIYFRLMELYVEPQYYRGRPYIGEYLDEKTGFWLKGDQERSRYYNHSTFNDLIITGLVGLRPRPDDTIEVNPLIPEQKWDWFCLDNVLYHGNIITIYWDKDGTKYNRKKGFHILVNGKEAVGSEKPEKLVCSLNVD